MNPNSLLAQLEPAIEPTAISFWPIAPIWWLIIFGTCITCAALIYTLTTQIHKRLKQRKYLRMLRKVINSERSPQGKILLFSNFVKRYAIKTYGRKTVAGLSGKQWALFLDKTIQGNRFTEGPGIHLYLNLYNQRFEFTNTHVTQVFDLLNYWVKHHK